ncbi:radical SAM/SPASM domain-containing protein [Paenibacillus oralis]|nr:radical SAM protein [Paenibacillus oralis]
MALRELCIHLTRNCNQKCRHCYYHAAPGQNTHMTLPLAQQIIKEASESGVKRVTLQGGETFLYPYIREICEYSKSLGLIVAVPTNGQFISNKNIHWIQESVDIVFFSIHGLADYHDAFVELEGAFNRAVKSVEISVEHGIQTGILSSVSTENMHQIGGLATLFDQMGVDILGLLYHSEAGRGTEIKSVDPLEWERFMTRMKKVQPNLNHMRIRFETTRKLADDVLRPSSKFCGCLSLEKNICFVDTEGFIYPCSLAMDFPDFCYGHITDRRLSDYFSSMSWEWARQKVELPEACTACTHLSICNGGCMVKRYARQAVDCQQGKYIPVCVLYPDIDVYEEISIKQREQQL